MNAEMKEFNETSNVVSIEQKRIEKEECEEKEKVYKEPSLPIKHATLIKQYINSGITSLSLRCVNQAVIAYIASAVARNSDGEVKPVVAMGAISTTSEQNSAVVSGLKKLLESTYIDYHGQLTKEYLDIYYNENKDLAEPLVYVPQNLSSEFSMANKQYNGAIKASHAMIVELFDNEFVHFKLRKETFVIKRPLINIFSTFSESDVYHFSKSSMQGKGLYSLFVNAYCNDHAYNDYNMDKVEKEHIVKSLKEHIASLKIMDEELNFNYSRYKKDLYEFALNSSIISINTNRLISNFISLVNIICLWNQQAVTHDICVVASEFIKFHAHSLSTLTAKKSTDDLNDTAYDSIRSYLTTPRSHRELVRCCKAYRNLNTIERQEVIDTLLNDQQIAMIPTGTIINPITLMPTQKIGRKSNCDRYALT